MQNEILKKLDLEHIWHPCTQMKDHENIPLIPIKKAEGIWLYDFNGKAYMDCISSWWVNLFGHCNKFIANAIKKQVDELEHVILAGFSHEPIIKLSARLCQKVGSGFNKCFYADNGSSAIEIALKMSFHYHLNQGKEKNKFLSLSNSYHGETLGALSVGDVALYKDTYKTLLLECLSINVPKNNNYQKELEELANVLKKYGNEICAFILEPLVQCAGNMHMYEVGFIDEAIKLCHEFKVQVIFDEIAVGFGRTGSLFALHQCKQSPDFICLSKGITGGFMPLSVVLTKDEIYNTFYASYKEKKAFLHSHSYTGNALACAAANAVLDIFEKENILEENKILSQFIQKELQRLKQFDFLGNFRTCGMISAFDILSSKYERPGLFVFEKALEKGLLLRPLGNTIYFMPPYIITKEQISYIIKSLEQIFKEF
ncbi:adenosylmethionine--8-amino-7-oxononanoate transaminase [Campylobacter hepaticus]|uniref:Adenosylmethionine-8-amino-7-oxononanoate aminotransferase n=1 Tax=Campylobacter hepaticus TaxID=1813019 RepID=A0A424Z329_9BACT|nr:adenosylmethionine--8-amino-7-oxononanoate transaminase [Campylobacter hepaticus]MDX2330997.1 adenosylmethionine--8-amino-7-oxononanoate transaminase [Campylobacter hepaticus]MDX2371678.1 adenosylmethionine--8-amino-7-oxononanoate transaminase [Campylobacter hepaticus]MDX2396862.1 adenosylmethionine--8-amino-7-oxononanoate transaminase [Campylobacter hepaticus]MDX5508836.1 adenosylmethionine--8-amino-7-oxononanoate transaminase [Campylobacter hepaticus]QOW64016.1 adenosylmethionine--8-amino